MSRIEKLNMRFLDGGRLSFAEFQRLLEAYGFHLSRVSGSHHIYARDGLSDKATVQPDGKEAKIYQLRQFRCIVDDNHLKLDDRS